MEKIEKGLKMTFKEAADIINMPVSGKWGGFYKWINNTSKKTIIRRFREAFCNDRIYDIEVHTESRPSYIIIS